jgi:hypothetical protein
MKRKKKMPIKKTKTTYTPLFENVTCCLCFNDLEPETITIDKDGNKWDVCISCKGIEKEIKE